MTPGPRGARVSSAASPVLTAAALIAVLTVLARIAGFGRWLVFSDSVGTNCLATVYFSANQVPNVLFEIVAGGALAGTVVPLLAGPLAALPPRRGEVDAIASALLTWTVLGLAPLTLAVVLAARPLSAWLVGDSAACPEGGGLGAAMLVVFAPQILLYGIGVVLTGVLQAHRRFAAPALAPLLSSVVVIACYVAAGATLTPQARAGGDVPAAAFAWLVGGTTAGVVALSLGLLWPVTRAGVRLRPRLHLPAPVARTAIGLAGAGLGVVVAQQVATVVITRVTNTSGTPGLLAEFLYAQAVWLLPYAVLALPVATSAFPRLAELGARGDRDGFARTAAASTRAVLTMAGCGAALLVAVAPGVGGLFTTLDQGTVRRLPETVTALAPGLLGFSLLAAVTRALYAVGSGRAAMVAGIAGWGAAAAGCAVVVPRVAPADRVAEGCAWATSAGLTLAGVLLLASLRRAGGPRALAGLWRTFVVLLAGALPAAIAGRAAATAVSGGASPGRPGDTLAGLARAVVSGGAGACVSLVVLAAVTLLVAREDLQAVTRRRRPVPLPSGGGSP